jgi:hypothetical protein
MGRHRTRQVKRMTGRFPLPLYQQIRALAKENNTSMTGTLEELVTKALALQESPTNPS